MATTARSSGGVLGSSAALGGVCTTTRGVTPASLVPSLTVSVAATPDVLHCGAATRHILAGITGLTGVPPPASHLGPLGHTSAITASLFVWPTTGMRRLPIVPTMAFGTLRQ